MTQCAIQPHERTEQTEESDAEPDLEAEQPAVVPVPDPLTPQPTSTQSHMALKRNIATLEGKIRKLKTTVQWLKVEKLNVGKKVSGSRTARKRQYKRRVKGVRFTRQGLAVSYEKYKSLLKIKLSQKTRKTLILKRRQQQDTLKEGGPKALERSGRPKGTCFAKSEIEHLGEFWRSVWEVRGHYNPSHAAISIWEKDVHQKLSSHTEDLTSVDVAAAWSAAVKKAESWKVPGPDKLHAHWFKAFPGMSDALRDLLFGLIEDPHQMVPALFVRGRTVLIPKSPGARAPDKQRLITCLNTAYKLLTGAITVILRSHATEVDLLPPEQKALKKGARGCLDALAVDTAIMEEVKSSRKDLAVAWVNFRKAFDA